VKDYERLMLTKVKSKPKSVISNGMSDRKGIPKKEGGLL